MHDNNKIRIAKKIKAPRKNNSYKNVPFDKLKIGESIFIKDAIRMGVYRRILALNYKNKKFTIKIYPNGVRVWRITKSKLNKEYDYKIEKGIKIPEIKQGTKYPIALLKVGQSFFVEAPRNQIYGVLKNILARAYYHKLKTKKEFVTRIYDNGIRMWRVK